MILTPEYIAKIKREQDPLILKLRETTKMVEEMLLESKQRREKDEKITSCNDGKQQS